jgi:hypothetical protein
MQARSTCGAGPYKQFWTLGVTMGLGTEEAQPLAIVTSSVEPTFGGERDCRRCAAADD